MSDFKFPKTCLILSCKLNCMQYFLKCENIRKVIIDCDEELSIFQDRLNRATFHCNLLEVNFGFGSLHRTTENLKNLFDNAASLLSAFVTSSRKLEVLILPPESAIVIDCNLCRLIRAEIIYDLILLIQRFDGLLELSGKCDLQLFCCQENCVHEKKTECVSLLRNMQLYGCQKII